jgi:glutathione S-transferase
MLKVWGRVTSSNVQKVMWTAAELGVPVERLDVGRPFGGNDTPEFLAMNPNGLVPTVEHEGMVLWESNSIVRYLGSRFGTGTLMPDDLQQRALAERWMDWLLSTIQPNWGAMYRGLVRTAPSQRDMVAIDAAVARLGKSYQILDNHLAGQDYLLGNDLTIADVPLGMSLYRYYVLQVERPEMPNIDAWYERLQARPAYAEHVMVSFDSLRVED